MKKFHDAFLVVRKFIINLNVNRKFVFGKQYYNIMTSSMTGSKNSNGELVNISIILPFNSILSLEIP